MLMNKTTKTHLIVITDHRQLDLLDYRHPKTVLFFLPNLILRRNPLGLPRLLPQLKVPDFPDMERE